MAIVDCGEWRGSPEDPARKLVAALGADWANVRDVVVSHYDTDHWEGFTKLAARSPSLSPLLPELNIYVPHFPTLVIENVVKFITTRSPDASVGTMLTRSMKPLLIGGKDPKIVALAKGDKVTLGGRAFDVLWPPARLTEEFSKSISTTLREVDEVADLLAKDPHNLRTLKDTLERLRIDDEVHRSPSRPTDDEGSENDVEFGCRRGSEEASGDGEFLPDDESDSDQTSDEDEAIKGLELPDDQEVQELVKKVFAKVRKLNNNLSLILLSQDDSTLLLGDSGPKVVNHVLGEPSIAARLTNVKVMLAPHHGSQSVPKKLPASLVCIAQAGDKHHAKWDDKDKHRRKHQTHCISLHDVGGLVNVCGCV